MNEDERFDRAIDRLTSDQSPRLEAADLTEDEQRMLRFAQLMRGSNDAGSPRSEFVEGLHAQLFSPQRVSRRTAFFSGLGALAAGILGGFGIDRAVQSSGSKQAASQRRPALVGKNGQWFQVATVADVPNGAIHTFKAGAVQGFLINRNGNYRAMSRICTHMGCALNFKPSEQYFVCPCHGAEFNLQGRARSGPHAYYLDLPPLPPLNVRVRGEKIEVFGA